MRHVRCISLIYMGQMGRYEIAYLSASHDKGKAADPICPGVVGVETIAGGVFGAITPSLFPVPDSRVVNNTQPNQLG